MINGWVTRAERRLRSAGDRAHNAADPEVQQLSWMMSVTVLVVAKVGRSVEARFGDLVGQRVSAACSPRR